LSGRLLQPTLPENLFGPIAPPSVMAAVCVRICPTPETMNSPTAVAVLGMIPRQRHHGATPWGCCRNPFGQRYVTRGDTTCPVAPELSPQRSRPARVLSLWRQSSGRPGTRAIATPPRAITGASAANPKNVERRSHPLKLSQPRSSPRARHQACLPRGCARARGRSPGYPSGRPPEASRQPRRDWPDTDENRPGRHWRASRPVCHWEEEGFNRCRAGLHRQRCESVRPARLGCGLSPGANSRGSRETHRTRRLRRHDPPAPNLRCGSALVRWWIR
jgi:hypothetical protein